MTALAEAPSMLTHVSIVGVPVDDVVSIVSQTVASPMLFFEKPVAQSPVSWEVDADTQVTTVGATALVTERQVVQMLPLSQVLVTAQVAVHVSMAPATPTVFLVVDEAAHSVLPRRESEEEVHVMGPEAAPLTAVHAVHTSESSQVLVTAQVAVHVSMAPATPTVFLFVPVSHAVLPRRESEEEVQVMGPVAAPVTGVHTIRLR